MPTGPQRARNHLGGLVRCGAPPEQIAEGRRGLSLEKIRKLIREDGLTAEDVIRLLVDEAPPFNEAQKLILRPILSAAGDAGAS
jgi:hypothetical protein